jgi:hypothetical protein
MDNFLLSKLFLNRIKDLQGPEEEFNPPARASQILKHEILVGIFFLMERKISLQKRLAQ